jgi:hypothetical protein
MSRNSSFSSWTTLHNRKETYKGYALGAKVVKNQTFYLVAAECPYDENEPYATTGWVKEEDIVEVL